MALFSRKKDKEKDLDQKQSQPTVDVQAASVDEKKADELVTKKTDKATKSDKTTKDKTHGQSYKHLVRPLVTEKTAFLGTHNQYVFEVSTRANKIDIQKSIEALYGVKPISINMLNVRGKITRYGRSLGKRKNWKKAIITLKQGDKIEVYEGV